jgi:serine protease Do
MSVKAVNVLYRVVSYVVVGGISLMIGMAVGENPSDDAVVGSVRVSDNPFIAVAEQVKPSVVQITTSKVVEYRYWDPSEDFFGGQFEKLFPEFFERRKRPRREQKRKQEGLGSGFIVGKEGYILTNYHVIKDVDEIQVKLLDEKKPYTAEIVGEPDAATDIAVLKINPRRKLTVAKLGDSDKLRVGEWVMAIGNPFGLEETVTIGVISAKGRSGFSGLPRYQDFIQTDASINLGNSGGPLVNINGEVVGLNTFIISPYVAHGLGFAIPINMAKKVHEKILKHGRVVRGYLGIIPLDIDPAMAKQWKLSSERGVVVADVEDDTPASRAGLKVQDVIIEFDGQEVKDEDQFRKMVADMPVGKEVEMKVVRNGKEEVLKAKIGELPSEERAGKKIEDKLKLGVTVREITPSMAERYDLEETGGVIVVDVEGGSSADGIIQPGDIIKEVNNHKIDNMEDYLSALDKVELGGDVIFLIRRGKYTTFVVVRAE